MARRLPKQPNEVLPYDFDFGPWLANEDDALQASLLTSEVTADAGITIEEKTHDIATGVVQVRISGGTAGHRYKVTCRITTAGGKVKELEFVLVVLDS